MSTTCKKRKPTMFTSMHCACEAVLEIDVVPGDEGSAWMLVHRFANAHAEHGYVTAMAEQNVETS